MDRRAEFASFLRSRRARLQPDAVGIPSSTNRRRTPGLRREEIAHLAGVSVDYYARLEQGRNIQPSPTVLEALSRALRLDQDEYRHLVALAEQGPLPIRRSPERVRPGVLRLVETLDQVPAFVLGRRMDVLAWNSMAATLICDFGAVPMSRRNMLWLLFLDPRVKALHVDWSKIARESIAYLRATSGRHPGDPMIAELVGELSAKSGEFREWWSSHDVREKSHGPKNLRHPEVGALHLYYEALQLPDGQDQTLITYTAKAGSASQARLDLLAVLARATQGTLRQTTQGP